MSSHKMVTINNFAIMLIAGASVVVANYTECVESIAKYPVEDCHLWQYKLPSGKCHWARNNAIENFLKPPEFEKDPGRSLLSKGYCVTFDKKTNRTYLGLCPYNTKFNRNPLFHLPANVSRINKYMCGSLHRTGLLCCHCKSGLGPAVFSYFRECKKCTNTVLAWFLFFVRLIAPITLFLVIAIVLRSNIAVPHLNGFVLMAQIIVTIFNLNPYIVDGLEHSKYSFPKFVADIYGIFNLDFFTYLIPSFCISKDMKIVNIMALEYLIALYPILFTMIVYCLISVHDSGNKILTICWKPFHTRLARFRRQFEFRGSIINAFATFLLLSFSKFCIVSWNLLRRVTIYDICGNTTVRTYYDANIPSLSTPYFVLVIAITVCVISVPILFLLLYQFNLFQKCVSACRFKFTLLQELANITQSCFKNGTEPGTRDYRWFAGAYLLLRVVLLFIIDLKYADLAHIFIPCIMSIVMLWLRPYRIEWCNALDSFFWFVLAVSNIWYLYYESFDNVYNFIPHVLKCVPLLYLFCYSLYNLLTKAKKYCTTTLKRNPDRLLEEPVDDELPHRLVYPNEYSSLLQERQIN